MYMKMNKQIAELNEQEIRAVSGGEGFIAAFILGIGYVGIAITSYFYGKYIGNKINTKLS